MNTRKFLRFLQLTLLVAYAANSIPSASGALLATTMNGYITRAANSAPEVAKDDFFAITMEYDDAISSVVPFFANGRTYWRTIFQISLARGYGSLYDHEVSDGVFSGSLGVVSLPSLTAPVLHREWMLGDIFLVTDNPGSPIGYGWIDYGSSGQGLLLLTNITTQVVSTPTTISPASSVPEPGSAALLGLGLAGLTFLRRRKPDLTDLVHGISSKSP